MKRTLIAGVAAITLAIAGAGVVLAQPTTAPTQAAPAQAAPARPTFAADGTVHVPAFYLPPSAFISSEYQARMRERATMAASPGTMRPTSIEQMRAYTEAHLAPQVEAARRRYPVDIVPQTIAGVPTQVITPREGVADRRRVLINLHGGGFTMCAQGCAMVESIPVASIGRFKVITVNYRQGPEHAFPAASEDVAAVYRELLRTYRPENIGIFGCSAGGALTGQAMSWFQAHDLPNPGAIGIFGAGGARMMSGDSAYVAAYIDGSFPPPNSGPGMADSYFRGADMNGPLVSPAMHPDVLRRFPPTLLITGTRAMDMSPAIYTHTELLKAGVDSQLVVGEGMGHCYIYDSEIPEARDAIQIAVNFFNAHLGRRPSSRR